MMLDGLESQLDLRSDSVSYQYTKIIIGYEWSLGFKKDARKARSVLQKPIQAHLR
jgi:hypothetical protein